MAKLKTLFAKTAFLMYILLMNSNEKKTWVSPEVKELGDAKEIIKGFTPGDPKVPGGGDGALDGASDA